MTRTHGRAPPGERVVDSVPHENWKVLTMLGAMRLSGMAAGATIAAPADGAIFRGFVQHALVPCLHKGDVVLWDNLPAHRSAELKVMVQSVGASVLPLPPYSPDFSLIEPGWSKVKERLRTLEPRTVPAVGRAARKAFASITAEDAAGWFAHCGYPVD